MTNKKNRFYTFCFSLLPGAGEMYLGFMKMGLSLMSIFFGIVCIGAILELTPLIFLAIISWFYSFFHVHNLISLPDEEFYAIEDEYLFFDKYSSFDLNLVNGLRKIIAACLIFVGIILLWNGVLDAIYNYIPAYMYSILNDITYRIPKILFGIVIIYIGIRMIRGKKNALDQESDRMQKPFSHEEAPYVSASAPESQENSEED